MNGMKYYTGIDGCRGGWFAVSLPRAGEGGPATGRGPEVEETMDRAAAAHPRRDLQTHDILDAAALAVTAALTAERGFLYMPGEPDYDPCGIPIQAVFCGARHE